MRHCDNRHIIIFNPIQVWHITKHSSPLVVCGPVNVFEGPTKALYITPVILGQVMVRCEVVGLEWHLLFWFDVWRENHGACHALSLGSVSVR